MKNHLALIAATVMTGLGGAAQAQDAGDWIFRVGVHSVQPKSSNHSLVNVDAAQSLSFNATYMLASNWGVEVLAALPFEHDVNLNGGARVAKVKELPPTVTLQYHLNPNGAVRPYVGLGLNYTLFFDESTRGALDGTRLELDPSFGLAAQAGVDIAVGSDWFVNLDARYIDIDTDASVNRASIGTVEIDPYAVGLTIGKRF